MVTRKSKKVEEKKVAPKAKVAEVEETTRNAQIKAIDFVTVFKDAEDNAEVAEHFGRNEIWVSSFASRLRKMGVKLKKMPRSGGGGGKRVNVDELNELIGAE